MFVGRKKELSVLENKFNSDSFDLIIIYGRRRIGKSTLIRKFIEYKNSIYFVAIENNKQLNLKNLSKAILEATGELETKPSLIFSSFQEAFRYVFDYSLNHKVVFTIDEYPYLAAIDPSISSILQNLIDEYQMKNSKLKLILCGSSMSFMENEILSYKAPLYGRKTAQIELKPLSFNEFKDFFPDLKNEEKVKIYSVFGGTPYYLKQVNPKKSFEENLKNTILNENSLLFNEPESLLKQEFNKLNNFNAILTAIASGSNFLSEISSVLNKPSGYCLTYINKLIKLQIVKKITLFNENHSKKTQYVIKDPLFRFWYKFVMEYSFYIYSGAIDKAYEALNIDLNDYFKETFTEIAEEYLINQLIQGNLDIEFKNLGKWWGVNPKTRTEVTLDLVGEKDDMSILIGQCYWKDDPVNSKDFKELVESTQSLNHVFKNFYLFSKSGFSNELIKSTQDFSNIHLVNLEEM